MPEHVLLELITMFPQQTILDLRIAIGNRKMGHRREGYIFYWIIEFEESLSCPHLDKVVVTK